MTTAALFWIAAAALGITCLAAMSALRWPSSRRRSWRRSAASGTSPIAWATSCVGGSRSAWPCNRCGPWPWPRRPRAGGIALWQSSRPLGFAVGAWAPALAGRPAAGAGRQSLVALDLRPAVGRSVLVLRLAGPVGRELPAGAVRLAGRTSSTWPCIAWPAASLTVPDEESFEEDIRTIVSEGHREGLLEEDAREMIEGVIELGDADVSQIMTPRTDMLSIPASLSWEEMLEQVIDAGHTRIPVYGRNRDDILGILHAKDLLPELAREPGQRAEHWTKLLRQPVFVPETKPIDALLQELQHSRNHMVVVLDEYGGVSGLVTMEDVLEEIVGEIVDEYDPAHVEGVRELGPGVCEAMGRVHIDEINERLGLGLPEDADYDTIGGFVFNELGHIPTTGEDLVWQNVRITVLDATRRRIERVRIEVLDAAGLPTPQG